MKIDVDLSAAEIFGEDWETTVAEEIRRAARDRKSVV